MASSYDYNEIQPGASDIDREAWPVMYDPYGDQNGLTEVSTRDTDTVDFSGKGTSNSKLSAEVKVSKQSGNVLRKLSDGLYVLGENPVLSINGSQFIGVTGEPQRPTITLKKSEDESNDLVDENGLYVHVPVKEVRGSDSIDITKDGDDREISVIISDESDNKIEDTPNGLYVASDVVSGVSDTSTLDLSIDDRVLSGNLKLDPNQGNVVLSTDNGLKAEIASGVLTEIESTNSITATKNKNIYNLSLNTDNSGNVQLDITENGLKANVDFPLDTLTGTNPIKVTVEKAGQVDEHVVSLDIASGSDNLLNVEDDGLRASLTTGEDQDNNVRFSGLGTPTSPLKANVDIPEDFIRGVGETSSLALSVASGTWELTGDVKVDNNHPGNVVLSFTPDGLKGEVEIPADFVTGVQNTQEIELTVSDRILTANIASGVIPQIQGSNSIDVQTSGNVNVLSANISSATDNTISVREDGLYVPAAVIPDVPVKSLTEGDGIEVRDDGEGNFTIGASISSASGNILSIELDGLYASAEEDYVKSVGNTDSIFLNVDQNGELTGELKIDTSNPSNVTLNITQNGLVASAEIPEDYISNVVDTDTVALYVDNGDLSASAKVSSKGDNQTDPVNALEIEQDGLWTPTLYLGPFDSTARPSDAITGQYIFDTDLGYCLYRRGGAWVNSTGAIIEGNVEPTGPAVEWIANPMTAYGDLIVGGPSGTPMRLGAGTERQELVVGAGGQLSWADKARSCQENFLVVDATKFESASNYSGRIMVSRVVCYHDCVCTELGLSVKIGNVGTVGLAIYGVDKALVARTEFFSTDQTIDGHVIWHDTENPYTLVAGQEYYFAVWMQSNVLQVLGKDVTGFDSSIVGCVIGQQSITEMPTTLGTLNTEQFCAHMVAR